MTAPPDVTARPASRRAGCFGVGVGLRGRSSSSAGGASRAADELPHLDRILVPRLALDARRPTSTPHGRVRAMAAATLAALSPPAMISRWPGGTSAASDQSNTWPDPGFGASRRIASAPYSAAWRTRASPAAKAWITIGSRVLEPPGRLRRLVAVQLHGPQPGLVGDARAPARGTRPGTRRR